MQYLVEENKINQKRKGEDEFASDNSFRKKKDDIQYNIPVLNDNTGTHQIDLLDIPSQEHDGLGYQTKSEKRHKKEGPEIIEQLLSNERLKIFKGYYCGKLVAIKGCPDQNQIEKEREILENLNDARIVKFFGTMSSNLGEKLLIMEFLDINLKDYLFGYELSLYQRIHLALEAAKGMKYLHSQNLVHLDYKPENVMYKSATQEVKIIDFGFSEWIIKTDNLMIDLKGSPTYMAPEIYLDKKYGFYTDVYSFGISLAEHINQCDAYSIDFINYFHEKNKDKNFQINYPYRVQYLRDRLFFFCFYNGRPTLKGDVDNDLRSLIERCWDKRIESRPSFAQIIEELEGILQRLK
jgi:serine/threonine protein kinase